MNALTIENSSAMPPITTRRLQTHFGKNCMNTTTRRKLEKTIHLIPVQYFVCRSVLKYHENHLFKYHLFVSIISIIYSPVAAPGQNWLRQRAWLMHMWNLSVKIKKINKKEREPDADPVTDTYKMSCNRVFTVTIATD